MDQMPKIGEQKRFKPKAFDCGLTIDCDHYVTGKVIWVHPRGRFYTVEVCSNGNTWRETMYPGE